jgi:hypothetical protein
MVLCSAAVVASIVLGNHNTGHHIVLWWPALMASVVVMLASASWVPPRYALTGREPRHPIGSDEPQKYLIVRAGLPADSRVGPGVQWNQGSGVPEGHRVMAARRPSDPIARTPYTN